jgi:hypothetical protein
MAKQRRKQKRPELVAYRQGDYLSVYIQVPIKWALVILPPILIKIIPEWWNFLQTILPILLK